jgi:Uma2 family endonuclease
MTLAATKLTYDDYLLIPEDGRRHEIIDGELYVNPAPNARHQTVSFNLVLALGTFVRSQQLGRVYYAPFDVVLSQLDVVQPDIMFISAAHEELLTSANVQGAPDLVIEILSPSTRKLDLQLKRKRYDLFGVEEYWIVDPENESVAIYRRGRESLEAVSATDPITSPLLPNFRISLAEIFAE